MIFISAMFIVILALIVIAVIMTISFIFIIIILFIAVMVRLSTFLMELDVATHQSARSHVTIREFQTEAVVMSGLTVINNNNLIGE